MREEGLSMAEEIEWFVGIDWASQSHQVCLVDARGECLGERAVAHGGPGIEELCDWLIARTGATPEVIGVAIEMTQGPVVEALLERGFCVYGINPKQLDRFRDRFTVAGAKDDRRDAHVLADSLRTDRHAFRRLSNDEPVIVQLREWSRMADDLQQERARLASRMREQGIVRKTACWMGGVRRRLRAWLRSPIAGIVFRRSSSSTPCGCTFASP